MLAAEHEHERTMTAARVSTMPGYLYFTIFTGLVVIAMLTGPRRPRALGTFTYMLSAAYNEAPFLFLFLLAISVVPDYLDGEPLLTLQEAGF